MTSFHACRLRSYLTTERERETFEGCPRAKVNNCRAGAGENVIVRPFPCGSDDRRRRRRRRRCKSVRDKSATICRRRLIVLKLNSVLKLHCFRSAASYTPFGAEQSRFFPGQRRPIRLVEYKRDVLDSNICLHCLESTFEKLSLCTF